MATLRKIVLSVPPRGVLTGPSLSYLRAERYVLLCRHSTSCLATRKWSPPVSLPAMLYSNSPAAGFSAPSGRMMPFEEYKKLKKALKLRARIAGFPMAFVGVALSSLVSVHLNPRMFEMTPEEVQPILGMDPIVFAALCGVGSGVVGFILGGAFFSSTWRLLFRERARQLQEREEDFFNRILKYRFSAFNKYDDDYYGEKVMTLSDYRQWRRQQQKKREKARLVQEEEAREADVERDMLQQTSNSGVSGKS